MSARRYDIQVVTKNCSTETVCDRWIM